MSPIEEQRKVIDQLYQIVKGSCPPSADAASCRFDFERFEDGSTSVGQKFNFFEGEKKVSAALDRQLRSPIMPLVKELHALMKSHTGGDWTAFTIIIQRDGSVTTEFEYPDAD
ncbi:MAG: hypothetical protein AAGF53_15455 [Pseudomonadota bacterium]